MALRKIWIPTFSSPTALALANASTLRTRATPPPGTIPSSTAARVAFMASSTRALLSFISISEAAPILMTATPPISLARRSCSFSRSQSEVVSSIWVRIWLIRPSRSFFLPAPSTMVVLSLSILTVLQRPRSLRVTLSSLTPISSEIT